MPLDTIPYAQPLKPKMANRNYTIALIVLALFCTLGALSLLFNAFRQTTPPLDPAVKWAFIFSAVVNGFCAAIMAATLIIRGATHGDFRVIWTKAVNIFLLFVIPFGTAIGIYGLW